jgi:hypothetical protein
MTSAVHSPHQTRLAAKVTLTHGHDKERHHGIGEIKKPFGADGPHYRRVWSGHVDQRIFLEGNVQPSLSKCQIIGQRSENVQKAIPVSGHIGEELAAEQNIKNEKEEVERIETREARPDEAANSVQSPLCDSDAVVVMDDEPAEDEEQSHTKPCQLGQPVGQPE